MNWDLIADIGGTNARFAALVDGNIKHQRVFSTKGDAGVVEALALFMADFESTPNQVCLAVAGPITSTTATITNAAQTLYLEEIKTITRTDSVLFINDFEAASWAMVEVDENDVICHQGPSTPPDGHRLVIGAGTGLGVGTLVRNQNTTTVIAGEGGHIGISPRQVSDLVLFEKLAQIWPEADFAASPLRIEAEALLSGTGIPKLYQAVCGKMDVKWDAKSTGEIFTTRDDKAAIWTVDVFRYYLASMAGDLAITNSAKGGVIFTGGVLMKNPWVMDAFFVDAFNDGGRFSKMRSEIPIYLYKSDLFGLRGAANALRFKV